MQVRWHREARFEAEEAARFYAERQPGLDQRFLDFLEDALHRISRRPEMYPKAISTSANSHASHTGLSIGKNLRQLRFLQSCTLNERRGTGRCDRGKAAQPRPYSVRDHVDANLAVEPDDFEYAPFAQEGGLGKVHQLFGNELNRMLEELNGTLAA